MRNYTGDEPIGRARRETGLETFDDEDFREGLELRAPRQANRIPRTSPWDAR